MVTESEGIVSRSEPTRIGGICYRDKVVRALLERKLVVFAGAGVSMDPPTSLPNFEGLIREFEELTGQRRERQESSDNYLGRLKSEGEDVHALVLHQLSRPEPRPNPNHSNLLRLFGSSSDVRLVTTNFDMMFEEAAKSLGWQPKVYTAPALPQARDFRGIVHLHGSIEEEELMVLTKGDFGRAYFQPGWATTFLAELVQEFTVLFVGYSGNDLLPDYLLTAVSEMATSRLYILRRDGDASLNKQSGIEVIGYQSASSDDHCALSHSLQRLGILFYQDINEWRESIEAAAAKSGLDSESDEETISLALRRPETSKYFAGAAKDVSWVRWLDQHGYLSPIFGDGVLTQTEMSLSGLVARVGVRDDTRHLVNMLDSHRFRVNAYFWEQLTLAIRGVKTDGVSLAQWVAILLEQPIERMAGFGLGVLASECEDRGDIDAALLLYEFLCTPRYDGEEGYLSGRDMDVKITGDTIPPHDGSLNLRHCENVLRAQHGRIGRRMVEIGIQGFERRHTLLRIWSKVTDDLDPWSMVYDPFNECGGRDGPEGFHLLFDMTREQIQVIMQAGGDDAECLVRRLATSDVPILRRLAVDAVRVRADLDGEHKAAWLMESTRFGDNELVSEVSRLLEAIFPDLGDASQARIVKWLLDGEIQQGSNEDVVDAKQSRWLWLLRRSDKSCELVKRELSSLRRRSPKAYANPYQERPAGFIGEAGIIHHPEPFTVEELLASPAGAWVDALLSWQRAGGWTWDDERHGLQQVVRQACVREFRWGRGLARELVNRGDTSTDLWGAILTAWSDDGSHVGDWSSVLDALNFIKARDDLSSDIANALVKFAKEAQGSDLFERANQLANDMWRENSDDAEGWMSNGILIASWNSAAGQIPMYWVEVAKRLIAGSVESERVTGELKSAISEIVHHASQQSTVGKVTLGAWFHVFYQLDKDWAQEALVPMFGQTHTGFEAAWEGFLWTFQGTLWLPDAMLDHVEAAIANRSQINTQHGVSVARLVSFLCCTGDPEPAHHLFKALIATAPDLQSRSHDVSDFVIGVRSLLRHVDVQRRVKVWDSWLREHLSRRKVGIPRGLVDGEVWELLSLIPVMLPATRDIVDVVLDLPIDEAETSNFTMIFYKVDVDDYPAEYARLMLYFDQYELDPWQWNFNEEHIDKLIANEAVPLEQRRKLEGLKLKYMIE